MAETVTVELGGRETILLQNYEVRLGVFEQPGSFECTLGWPYAFRGLAEQFPPKTPYKLRLNGKLIQTGFTDGFSFSGSGSSTTITLCGRDPLQRLIDTEIDADLSVTDSTYAQITELAFERSGLTAWLERAQIPGPFLIFDNEANRKAITGTKSVTVLSPPVEEVEQTEVGPTIETAETKKVKNAIRGEVGSTWWDFLVKQYRRVGLFLWCGADGVAVLSRPSGNQRAIARLFRKVGVAANITAGSFSNDTTRRHSECIVFAKGQAKKSGTSKQGGRFVDSEMVAYLNPREADRADGGVVKLVKTVRDNECTSQEQAQNLAKREIAEERRNGWKLSYEVAGHSIVGLGADDGELVTLTSDIVVDVEDEDFGVFGPMYIEGVALSGSPRATTTRIELLRIEDLFFGNEVEVPKKRLQSKGIAVDTVEANVFIGGILADPSAQAPGLSSGWQYPSPDPYAAIDAIESVDNAAPTEHGDQLSLKIAKNAGG